LPSSFAPAFHSRLALPAMAERIEIKESIFNLHEYFYV